MNDKPIRKALTAGKLTMFSSGEWSDYTIQGVYVALKDLTLDELKAKSAPLVSGAFDDDLYSVEAMLVREGYLLEVDVTEVYVGDYDRIRLSIS